MNSHNRAARDAPRTLATHRERLKATESYREGEDPIVTRKRAGIFAGRA